MDADLGMKRSEAQRAADARYEKKRRSPLAVRLTEEQWRWLEAQAQPGEKLAHAMLRLAGAPGAPPNDKPERTRAPLARGPL